MAHSTVVPTPATLNRAWHLIDAQGQVLGRVATEAAVKLMGKNKTDFARHLDMGDHVVILNAEQIAVTGSKESQKLYHRHSGYPGGFRKTTLTQLRASKPTEILHHAISGMLPDNKLKASMLRRLHLIIGSTNPYAGHFK
jgi:large subunit ribosomal protein L13